LIEKLYVASIEIMILLSVGSPSHIIFFFWKRIIVPGLKPIGISSVIENPKEPRDPPRDLYLADIVVGIAQV
jgi:hypothetical protein